MDKICTKVSLIIGLVGLVLLILLTQAVFFPTENQRIKSFYSSNTATLISPHSLREQLHKGHENFVLIDTREKEDYLRGHITTAINIVPSKNLVNDFRNLEIQYPDKEILIYCYTHVCMRGKKVGKELADNGVYVKELGIGFNEWKNFWRQWNYEDEWEFIDINEFITIGEEPGVLKKNAADLFETKGCSEGEYGC